MKHFLKIFARADSQLTIKSKSLKLFLAIPIVCALFLANCDSSEETSTLHDNGTLAFPSGMASILKKACNGEVPNGIKSNKISTRECYLFMAGVTSAESSWNIHMAPQAWGIPSDPARGLTQSRNSDARYVGLSSCDGKLESDPVCNVRVGLRNIVKRGSTLDNGISVHLGGNTGAKSSYLATIERVWNRQDIRSALGITGYVRPFSQVRFVNLRGGNSSGSVGGYTCEQQKDWGKCHESWMHPVCDSVCR